jgi:peptide/nickel transport system substrate-binding protein
MQASERVPCAPVDATRPPRWRAWLSAAGLALGAAVLSPGAIAQQPTTVKIVLQSQLRILDPVLTVAYSTRNHGYLIYDTLFSMDAKSVPQPQMVERYTVSADKMNYSFTLRPGLKFHDGTPVTSEDVIASLKRWQSRDQMGVRLFAALQEMKAVDPRTFTIQLKSPFGLVLETLAKQSSPVPFIMPARIAAAPPSQAITEFVGSGPWKFVPGDFQPAVKATYLKFNEYVPRKEAPSGFAGGKVALADRLELVSIPDPQTAVQALRAGEIDYIEDVPPDLMSQLEKAPGITLKDFGANSDMLTLRMNWLQPPFNDVKVRRAALAAINQVDYLDAQFGNPKIYQLCGAVLSCVSPYATEQYATQTKAPDLAKARALLKESGYDGSKVVILHPTDITVLSAMASITAQALRGIGMNVEIQSMDYTTMQSRRTKKDPIAQGGWNIVHSQWSTLDLLTPIINPNLDGRGEAGYIGWSKSDRMEKLRNDFAAESDMAKKKQIAVEVQKLNYEEVFYIPLGGFSKIKAYNAKMARMVDAPLPLFWLGSRP